MLIAAVRRVVGLCSHYPWPVVALAAIIAIGSAVYSTTHFAITTDVNKLISPDLEWRKRELAYEAAFPGPFSSILVVVDARTPELAAEATKSLAQRLSQQRKLFHSVRQLDGGPFFARNGLLFQSESELAQTTQGLASAGPDYRHARQRSDAARTYARALVRSAGRTIRRCKAQRSRSPADVVCRHAGSGACRTTGQHSHGKSC